MRRAAALATLLVGLTIAAPGARAASPPAPELGLLPGFDAAQGSTSAGVRALARYLPKGFAREVRSLRGDAAAATGNGERVQVTLLGLRRSTRARPIVAAWGRGARKARASPRRAQVGSGGWVASRGKATSVVWRGRLGIGIVQFRGPGGSSAEEATGFARMADAELSRPRPATAWQGAIEETRADGTLPKRAALEAFVLAYGPLPGVKRPRGRKGEVHEDIAANWTLRYFRSLSAKQRRVVAKRLDLPSRGGAQTRRGPNIALGIERDPKIEADVNGFLQQYFAMLGIPGPTFEVVAGAVPQTLDGMDARAFDANGVPAGDFAPPPQGLMAYCRVRVGQAPLAQPARYPNWIAHEAFHCVQNQILGELVWKKPDVQADWVSEGSADWASQVVAPLAYPGYENSKFFGLKTWATVPPGFPLFASSYGGGAAFFAHIDDSLPPGGFTARALPTLQATGNEAAFAAAGGAETPAHETWGSRRFRVPEGGSAWTMNAPFPPPLVGLPTYHELKAGTWPIPGWGFAVASQYTTSQAVITSFPGYPIVRLKVSGFVRLLPLLGPGTPAQDRVIKDGEIWLRTEGDGQCPPGHTGSPPATEPWAFPSALALTGQAGVQVDSHSLDEFCDAEPEPVDCSAGGCGSSNGDPHVDTFDGQQYDFQAAGEFTLVRSRSGDLEVQARQQPARLTGGIPAGTLTLNTAFAMKVGGSRVGVYAAKDDLAVRVKGKQVAVPTDGASVDLPGGGRLADAGDQLAVVWPDGSEARVWSVGSYGVAIMMRPAPSRAGQLIGLFGNANGNPADDFATRGGKALDAGKLLGGGNRAFKLLYDKFGDSWRIKQRDSLFDYSRGRNTASYTRQRFPVKRLTVGSLPGRLRAEAEQICREAGVTEPIVLENCILDVAATGDRAFAEDAVTLEATRSRSGGWRRLSEPFQPPGGGVFPSLAVAGDRVVAAYRHGDSALEAASFSVSGGRVRDVSRRTVVEGWWEIARPFLLAAPGGGLQLLFDGEQTVNPDDPLNGVVLSQLQADGAFGPPVRAAQDTDREARAATDDAGIPLWAARGPVGDGPIYIWRGSQNATFTDLGSFAHGSPIDLARDTSGRLWLAWEQFGGAGAGVYMGQLDPGTGAPAAGATPQLAPLDRSPVGPARLACGTQCRLVFSPESQTDRLVSWAPGEGSATEVAVAAGAEIGLLDAVAAPDGRLWAVWTEFGSESIVTKTKLGDAAGAGGQASVLNPPTQLAFPGDAKALALPGQLVLAVFWVPGPEGSAVWARVVPAG